MSSSKISAHDVDNTIATNEKLNKITEVTLKASGWTGNAAPYVQTIVVPGITEDDNPQLVSMLADGSSEAVQKAYMKAFGFVCSGIGITSNGSVTFKTYKKPTIDILVGLKGV